MGWLHACGTQLTEAASVMSRIPAAFHAYSAIWRYRNSVNPVKSAQWAFPYIFTLMFSVHFRRNHTALPSLNSSVQILLTECGCVTRCSKEHHATGSTPRLLTSLQMSRGIFMTVLQFRTTPAPALSLPVVNNVDGSSANCCRSPTRPEPHRP